MLNDILRNLRKQDWTQELIQKGNAYIVGGCVRDAYRNQSIKDIDIVVEGLSMDEIKKLLKHYGKVNIVGQSFAVINFHPDGHIGEDFDIAVPRIDRKVGTGHKDFEVETEGITIYDDLKRRDFTINSIAVNVKTGEVIDPFNGVKDIHLRILRATDKSAFIEDALRILRAIQFASRFNFTIELKTLELMRKNANLIKQISGERILEEFNKILMKHGSTLVAYDLIEKTGLDKVLFGQKFSREGFEYFDKLDPVSFYYILGSLGHATPSKFYKEKLKGEANMIKALQVLEKNFDALENKPEEELKWTIFLMLKSSPMLKDTKVITADAAKVIRDMKDGKIPMKLGDIPVTGNDIMDKFNVKDIEVGNIIAKMYQDALMNKFDWKNKEKTLKYLENI
jgi:tRNA nucleotidyltransferase/poly(A) polymerase